MKIRTQVNRTEVRLRQALALRPCTLLAIGPMSKNCVDAVLELAYEHPTPLMLIASRRQVDAAAMGGGYVHNWDTASFAQYVRARDPERRVIIARDHGGPWQGPFEVTQKMDTPAAMASAKQSFATDIAAGFDMIHLDPSIDIHNKEVTQAVLLERLFELYDHCLKVSAQHQQPILIEVGTEEQSGLQQTQGQVRVFLQRIEEYCTAQNYPKPFFVVVQTGTKVMETRNIGVLAASPADRRLSPPEADILALVKVCQEFGVHMKEHNTDYLSDEILQWHPSAGIHAANVAPEFGVIETQQLLRLFEECNLTQEKEEFLHLAFESQKWEKWLLPNSAATDYYKAIMAGHYVFSHPIFSLLKNRLIAACAARGFDADQALRHSLKHAIRRYMFAFNLLL